MLPLLPPKMVNDLANESFRSFGDAEGTDIPSRTLPMLFGAMANRIAAWRHSRRERRFGTQVVLRSMELRSIEPRPIHSQRAPDTFPDPNRAA